jgi:two-component system, sporulation sensor kinase E
LKEQSTELLTLLDSVDDFICITDLAGTVQWMNCYAAERLGYSREQVSGRDVAIFYPAEQRPMLDAILTEAINSTGSTRKTNVLTVVTRENKPIPIELKVAKSRWNHRDVLLGIARDITERLQMERALRDSDERWQFALENSGAAIWDWEVETGKVFYSDNWKKMLGFTVNEIDDSLHEWEIRLHPDDRDFICKQMARHFRRQTPDYEGEQRLLCKDGTYKWFMDRGKVITWTEDGKPLRVIGTHTDISKLKHSEAALRESEEKYRRIVELANEGIWIIDVHGNTTFVNDKMAEMLGYTVEEMIGRSVTDFVVEKSAGALHIVLERRRRGLKEQLDICLRRRNGTLLWTIVGSAPIFNKDGEYTGALAMLTDVTARKQAEERRFFKAFNAGPSMMYIATYPEEKFINVNDSFCRSTGYSPHQVIGLTSQQLNIWVDPEEHLHFLRELLPDKSIHNLETCFRTKSQQKRVGLFSAELIELSGEQCMLVTMIDITEIKRIKKEMARLSQLHLVGEIAASIGHEIRNPMTTVRGFLQMLYSQGNYSKDQEFFKIMIDELDRANWIIAEFLSLAQNKPIKLQSTCLNSVVKILLPLIQANAAAQDKNVETRLGSVSELQLDEKEIRQLIFNLCNNGLEAMTPGGTLTISTYTVNNEVVLCVEDLGHGIPEELQEKISVPFFTTKEQGTGLGLSVCYGIAARHSAAIDFETNSKGTKFFVRFPVSREGSATKII